MRRSTRLSFSLCLRSSLASERDSEAVRTHDHGAPSLETTSKWPTLSVSNWAHREDLTYPQAFRTLHHKDRPPTTHERTTNERATTSPRATPMQPSAGDTRLLSHRRRWSHKVFRLPRNARALLASRFNLVCCSTAPLHQQTGDRPWQWMMVTSLLERDLLGELVWCI